MIPDGQNLFVIDLHYNVPFDAVEPHLDAHMAFIQEMLAKGVILVAGRKVPRTGGVILATAESLDEITALMATDPFAVAGVIDLNITEFVPGTRHPLLS